MRTARSSSRPGGSPPGTPQRKHPQEEAPPQRKPTWEEAPPLWTEFLTHASENITLPQTFAFAGSNNSSVKIAVSLLRFI